jgi:hypothetical protein
LNARDACIPEYLHGFRFAHRVVIILRGERSHEGIGGSFQRSFGGIAGVLFGSGTTAHNVLSSHVLGTPPKPRYCLRK